MSDYPVFATGARVSWNGIPATVISGNEPNEWVADYPYVSLEFDKYNARMTRYMMARADDLSLRVVA